MELNTYTHSDDLSVLIKLRGLDPTTLMKDIPNQGYVVRDVESVIAIGFMRQVEGNYFGIVDSFITHPHRSSEDRHKALDMIMDQLQKDARNQGLRYLVMNSSDKGTLMRASRLGFLPMALPPMVLDLSTGDR